jgi:hypothetical protein
MRNLYRVWDKQQKIMLENAGVWGTSFFVFCCDCPVDWVETVHSADYVGPGAGENWCICNEERFVIEQGFYKDGKLLYDGDVIRFTIEGKKETKVILAKILWVDDDLIFGWGMTYRVHDKIWATELIWNGEFEIIGNEHEIDVSGVAALDT